MDEPVPATRSSTTSTTSTTRRQGRGCLATRPRPGVITREVLAYTCGESPPPEVWRGAIVAKTPEKPAERLTTPWLKLRNEAAGCRRCDLWRKRHADCFRRRQRAREVPARRRTARGRRGSRGQTLRGA